MKKIFMLASFAIANGIAVNAQTRNSGIYLTEKDFENQHLSYSVNDESKTNKIQFHEFFNRPFVTIKNNGRNLKLFKEDFFAYQKKGRVVRTQHFVSYTFAEKGVIYIYFKDMNVSTGKGSKMGRKYYYSVSGKSDILPLTVYNLKRSFPGKANFHHFLDAQFRRDSELAKFDDFQKKFKVNYLLETTIFGSPVTPP